jgi:hypothetical protein
MARFFPGQRIKKVGGAANIDIIAIFVETIKEHKVGGPDIVVKPLGPYINCKTKSPGTRGLADTISSYWVPYTDSYDKVEWADCLWSPETKTTK